MTKRDDEDFGLALVSGGIGAALGYGKAQSKIQILEAQNRDLQNENSMLRNTLSAKDDMIAQLQTENRKLKEERGSKSVKNTFKSLFDRS